MGGSASSSTSSSSLHAQFRRHHQNSNSNFRNQDDVQRQLQQQQLYMQYQQHQMQAMQQQEQMMNPQMRQNAPLPIKPQSNVNVMQNDIILRKLSVNILNNSDGSLSLEFEFDALSPVILGVFFFVQQSLKFFTNLHESFMGERAKYIEPYNSCTKEQKVSIKFPEKTQNLSQQFFVNKDKFWPIIIQIRKVDEKEQKQLFYYFEIIKNADSFKAHLKKQALEYNGDSFEIQEIYGVENTDLITGEVINAAQPKQAIMEDCNKECIICMTDLIDTVIMPCRHMCICIECAKTFQKKKTGRNCPVCRKEIESFLRISKLHHQEGVVNNPIQEQQQQSNVPKQID